MASPGSRSDSDDHPGFRFSKVLHPERRARNVGITTDHHACCAPLPGSRSGSDEHPGNPRTHTIRPRQRSQNTWRRRVISIPLDRLGIPKRKMEPQMNADERRSLKR
jgi:hypothetical protein